MASEYLGRNICVGYNFEDDPDTSSRHNLDRKFWYAFETNLAIRLISDFGKEIPQMLAMQSQSSFSFLSMATVNPQMLQYPSRMPIGRGNKYYHRPWRYYPVFEYEESCTPNLTIGNTTSYTESFASWLADLEEITSVTVESSGDGLEVIDYAIDGNIVTYDVEAISAGTYDITITATAEITPDYGDMIFLADYTIDENATYAIGSITGTLNGSATISSGKLDLTAGVESYVEYSAEYNIPTENTGCIRMRYTPNYSSVTGLNIYVLFDIFDSTVLGLAYGSTIVCYHYASGLKVEILDSTGNSSVSILYDWDFISGIEYEIEIDWDLTSGLTQLFINGTSVGSDTTTMTTSERDSFYVGHSPNLIAGTPSYNSYIDDFTVYSEVQHTSDYEVTDLEELITSERTTTRTKRIIVLASS